MGLTAYLDTVPNRKDPSLAANQTPVIQPIDSLGSKTCTIKQRVNCNTMIKIYVPQVTKLKHNANVLSIRVFSDPETAPILIIKMLF